MQKETIINDIRNYFDNDVGVDVSNLGLDDKILGELVDSIEVVKLVMFIEQHFNLKLPPFKVNIEQFATLQQMSDVIVEATNS